MIRTLTLELTGLFATLLIGGLQTVPVSSQSTHLPAQAVLIDVPGLAVLGENGTFRDNMTPLNPTNRTPPFFQVWDPAFLDILGSNPSIRVISERDDFEFAFEAPIWNPATNEVFFSSPPGNNGMGGIGINQVSKIDLDDVKGQGPQNITFTKVPITPELPNVNGGTPYKDKLLFTTDGNGSLPAGLSLVEPRPPYNSTTILDNFHGRQFNSLDDGKVHPKSGAIFFTDLDVGTRGGFRPPLMSPKQVYRFDPETSQVRLVADGFNECNGIAFSPDGSVAYVTDTGALGSGSPATPATIYAFDVDKTTQTFTNRRVLAYIDTGAADGIQVDSKGNVYAGCGDGVQIFNTTGLLLGKIFTGARLVNMVFAGTGKLVLLGVTKIYLVEFAAAPSIVELQ